MNLRPGFPFGCLAAALLGVAMTLVIVIGSLMGDCDPGPGCHDHDGFIIGKSLLLAVPVVVLAGVAVALLATVVERALRGRLDRPILNGLLAVGTVIVVCFGFDGAFAVFRWLTAAVGQ